MRYRSRRWTSCILAAACAAGVASSAHAIDFRFDNATVSNGNDTNNKYYFLNNHLTGLAFPSANGHDVELAAWTVSYERNLNNAGNTLGMYYNDFHKRFPAGETAAQSVAAINTWVNSSNRFGNGPAPKDRWLVLNEIDAATWNDATKGNAYRTWMVDTLKGLHDLGYEKIVLWSPRYLASKTHAATFQSITNYAYLGLETYLDGYKIKNTYNYNLAQVQAYYQGYYDAWTSVSDGPGLDPSRLFAGEHFGVYPRNFVAGQYFGSNGISGTDWQKAIQIRSLAIRNIPFGGFMGYMWERNELATGDDATDLATQLSYERAYAATMVVQTEVPTWTGNGGGAKSWTDGFNWTGGLPSTTQHPYPLLAATNPTLPKQTTANFFKTIRANTTITLDGNQSVTRLAFDSPYIYTIAPGTGGSLTLTGSGASLAVTSGSHVISSNLAVASSLAANLTGNLHVSGPLSVNGGLTVTKSGGGTLTLSGQQTWALGSELKITGGTVNLQSDTGANGQNLNLNVQTGGTAKLSSPQRLASLQIGAGATATITSGGNNTLLANTLSIDGVNGGKLDLANNSMILKNADLSAIRTLIEHGFNDSNWLGNGITSSIAANDPDSAAAIGFASTADADIDAFGGVTGLDDNDIVVTLTTYGDADLSGETNLDDFPLFIAGLEDKTFPQTWYYGDFNYSGDVNLDDFPLFIHGLEYNLATMSELATLIESSNASQADKASMHNALAAVPEPASAGMLAAAAFGVMARRRRARESF